MKKLKFLLTTLSILLALGGVFAPVQIVRAESGDPQGTTDSQRRSTTAQTAAAFWAAVAHALGLA